MGKKDVVAVETVEEVLAETGVEVAEAEIVVESEPTIADVVAAVAVPVEGVALEGNLGVVAGLTPDQCAVVLGLPKGTLVTSAQEQEAIRLLSSDPGVVAARFAAERAYKLQSYGNV